MIVPHDELAAVSGGMPAGTDDELAPGTLIGGRYRIDAAIARGGMATVYRGHDERLARDVAIKLAPPSAAPAPLREEQASSALIHANIVSIFDAGEIAAGEPGAGSRWIVMEYVDGTTAHAAAPVAWPRALAIVRQAAEGLAAAHARGIVHCDVKPGNLLIDLDGRVKVADFGVAAGAGSEVGDYVHGSPAYIAPERLRGERCDPRVDVFGLGGVLGWLLTGQQPPLDRAPQLPPGTPPELSALIARARAVRPEERYRDAAELAQAIDALLASSRQDDVLLGSHVAPTRRAPVRHARPVPASRDAAASAFAGTAVLPAQPPRLADDPLASRAPGAPGTGSRRIRRASAGPRQRAIERFGPARVVLAVTFAAILLIGLFSLAGGGDGTERAAAAHEMPAVVGQTFGPAVAQLHAQGIVVDRVEIVYVDGYLNEVVVQQPAPGSEVSDDDVVVLVVRTSR